MGKCYITSDLDRAVAKAAGNFMGELGTARYFAYLRGIYDERNGDQDWNSMEIDDVKELLTKFEGDLKKEDAKKLKSAGTNASDMFVQLQQEIPDAVTRENRVSWISHLFSEVVDRIKENDSRAAGLDRKFIIKGTTDADGNYIFGQAYIITAMYRMLGQKFTSAWDIYKSTKLDITQEERDFAKYKAAQIRLILKNWAAFVTIARLRIRDIEGIKLGAFNDFTADTNDGNFELEDLQEKIDIEEASVREGWQEIAEAMSAYASIGSEVRALLASTPQRNQYGEIEKDDLGNTKYLDPLQAHQTLLDAVRGATSEASMVRKLTKYVESQYNENYNKTGDNRRRYWLAPILDKLTFSVEDEDGEVITYDTTQEYLEDLQELQQELVAATAQGDQEKIAKLTDTIEGMKEAVQEAAILRSKVFADLKRNFQPLYVVQEVFEKGVNFLKTICLNDKKGFSFSEQAKANLKRGRSIDDNDSYLISRRGSNTFSSVSKESAEALANYIKEKFIDADEVDLNGRYSSWFMSDKDNEYKKQEKISAVKYIGSTLGFNISQEAATKIVTNSRYAKRFQTAMVNLHKYGLDHEKMKEQFFKNGGKLNIINFLDIKPGGSVSDKGAITEAVEKIGDIISAVTTTQEVRVPYKDKKGKNTMLSSDVLPSYLGDFMEDIKEFVDNQDTQGLRNFLEERYFNNCPMFAVKDSNGNWKIRNVWLRELYNSDLTEDGNFAEQFGTFRLLGDSKNTGAKRFENYTKKRHAWSMMELFLAPRKIAGEKGNRKNTANYPLFVLGDSGVCKSITAKYYTRDTVMKELVNMANAEIERARLALEMNQTCELNGWEKLDSFKDKSNILKFTSLPFLNDYLELKDVEEVDPITQKTRTVIKIYSKLTEEEKKQGQEAQVVDDVYIETCIRQSIDNDFENFYRQISGNEALKSDSDMGLTDLNSSNVPSYLSRFLTNEEIADASKKSKEEMQALLKERVKDFYANYKLATACQIQMFTIDPIFYSGTEDLQKRYKELHAPGTKLSEDALDWTLEKTALENGEERAIYFDDISISADEMEPGFMDIIRARFETKDPSVIDAYTKNTLTDGQGYRTLDSYRKVMIAAGKWNDYLEQVYNDIQDIRDRMKASGKEKLKPEEITKLSQLFVIFQPLKPYLYTIEDVGVSNGRIMKVPVQHKYAEVIIIPELCVPGSNLRALGEAMEENGIDVACSTKCVKVGSFGSMALDFKTNSKGQFVNELDDVIKGLDENGNIIDSPNVTRSQQRAYIKKYGEEGLQKINPQTIKESMQTIKESQGAYVHSLKYRDFRIQTNVPAHINASNLFGTQIRKIIMTGINKNGDYSGYLGGAGRVNLGDGLVGLNGNRLIQFYNQLITANIIEGYRDFEKAINSMDKVSKALIQNVIANSRENEANIMAYCLTGDGQFLVPLYELGIEHNTSQALISLFKKMVNKQRIQGGSLVQASAWGITKIEEGSKDYGDLNWHTVGEGKNGNIVYGDCEIPFDFKWTDQSGREHQLDFNDYCNPDGTFKMSGRKLNIGGITVDETLIEKDYPGILDIVSYRIPTESQYSMMRLRVKRCSLPTQGGVIRVPAQGTTTAGFDFDIDKLYLMRKQFAFIQHYESEDENLTEDEKNAVWAKVYNDNPSIRTHLEQAKKQWEENSENKDKTHKKSLNSYWDESEYLKNNYDKNELFSNALSDLINQGEIAPLEKTVKITRKQNYKYDFNKRVMNSQDENGKTIRGNNKVARNNMLLDLIIKRLEDPETLDERFQPGEFKKAKQSAKIMRVLTLSDKSFEDYVLNGKQMNFAEIEANADKTADPKPNYDYTDPLTLLTYNEQNQVAGKLIGIFANQNVNYAISTMLYKYELNSPIAFGNHMEGLKDLIHSPNAKKTCAELLSASVDAVKDPVLNYLNLNEITADAAAVLARLGYSTTEIGLLLNQPVIRDLCQFALNSGRSTSSALNHYMKKYEGVKFINNEAKTYLNSNRLANNIVINSARNSTKDNIRNAADLKIQDANFQKGQAAVLQLFSEILGVTKEVSDFVTNTKFTAANAVSVSFGSMIAQQLKVKRYVEDQANAALEQKNGKSSLKTSMIVSELHGDSKRFIGMADITMDDWNYLRSIDFSPFAYEQCMFDMNRRALEKMADYFPYRSPLYKETIDSFDEIASYPMDEDTVNDIIHDIMLYKMGSMSGNRFNKNTIIRTYGGELMTQEQYYKYVFPDVILNTSQWDSSFGGKITSALQMLSKYNILSSESHSEWYTEKGIPMRRTWYSFGLRGSANLDFDKKQITALFENLYNDPETRWFVEDLYMYDFFQGERGFGPKSFTSYLPQSITANITMYIDGNGNPVTYRDWLIKHKNAGFGLENKNDIITYYIRRHSDNRRFVKQLYSNDTYYNYFKGMIRSDKGVIANTITVTTDKTFKTTDKNGQPKIIDNPLYNTQKKAFVPAFTININGTDYLYICKSGTKDFNNADGAPMTYERVTPLKAGFTEYNIGTTTEETETERAVNQENLIGVFDESDMKKPVTYTSLYEKAKKEAQEKSYEDAILEKMDPTLRQFYETSSEEGKREILDEIKNKKECYVVNEDGTISKKLC